MNLMWQPGETVDFLASDHVAAIHRHARLNLLDIVVVNTAPITAAMRRRYAAQGARPVVNDVPRLEELGVRVVGRRLLGPGQQARHDPVATAAAAVDLALEGRRSGSQRSKMR